MCPPEKFCWPAPPWRNVESGLARFMAFGDFASFEAAAVPWRDSLARSGRRLVQDSPENSELSDGIAELIEPDGFDDIRVSTQLVAFDEVALLAGGGEHNNGNRL